MSEIKKEINKGKINNFKSKVNPTYIYALGGLGEVGKNMYVVEEGEEIWIMDSGIKFSSELTLNGIIPSFNWLVKNNKKIKGLIITHGHEDHIGSIPHLISSVRIPKIYAGKIAASLIKEKVYRAGLKLPKINIINKNYFIESNNFQINFFTVTHSIPDCFGVSFKSKNGTIVNTADFKFDLKSIGQKFDFDKVSFLGKKGVDLLLSDSTNSLVSDFSLSENEVSNNLEEIIKNIKGRVILTSFASNVYRVREVVLIAQRLKRKVCVIGFSMDKVIKIASRIKYINVDQSLFIKDRELKNIKDEDVLILSTGSQGEENAALSKMALNKHKEIKLRKEDTIIFSSGKIPGNYEKIESLINNIFKIGSKIIDNYNTPGIHASGHGGKQEQLLMFNLLKPNYFFPVHGELIMQSKHAETAKETGVSKNNIFILKNGDRLKMVNGKVSRHDKVFAENVFIDSTSFKKQSNKVINDRRSMIKKGIVVADLVINSKENKILLQPKIKSFGVLNENKNKVFLEEISKKLKERIEEYYETEEKISFVGIKNTAKNFVENYFFEKRKIDTVAMIVVLNTI